PRPPTRPSQASYPPSPEAVGQGVDRDLRAALPGLATADGPRRGALWLVACAGVASGRRRRRDRRLLLHLVSGLSREHLPGRGGQAPGRPGTARGLDRAIRPRETSPLCSGLSLRP